MIVSVSRRTDIPAFYIPWLFNRLKAGFALTPNPYNAKRLSRVPLAPEIAECLVFWSKNPAPMLEAGVACPDMPEGDLLSWLDARGYRYYFQFTLTPYGRDLERNLPPKTEIVRTVKRLSARIGSSGVVWRYDPVILDEDFSLDYHKKAFAGLCSEIGREVRSCVFSFADSYPRLLRKIQKPAREILGAAASEFAEIAARHDLRLFACAEEGDYSAFGIERSSCIDGRIAVELNAGTGSSLLPRPAEGKDRGQRKKCGCVKSVDIGMYGACAHGCTYCYACQGGGRRNRAHDPESPMLFGRPKGDEIVTERY
jgi:hypothetical protein